MTAFTYRDGTLHAESVSLSAIAQAVGTPTYVYSTAALQDAAARFRDALAGVRDKRLAFAVKANPSHAVLAILARAGYGADIVSGGELAAALAAGMTPRDVIYSGVGKTAPEMCAALDAGIGSFNLELEREGEVLSALAAARGLRVPALLRINPGVDAHTHAKITTGTLDSKFGVPICDAPDVYDRLARLPGLDMRGLAVHIGSQISDLGPLETAYARIGELLRMLRWRGHATSEVDLGGGLGVSYQCDAPGADIAAYGAMVKRVTADWGVRLSFEPGRFIAAAAGVLVTRVVWVKPGQRHPFVIVDAAMNDLARPALYDAWHDFAAVTPRGERFVADIVGPVCESGDTFARGREIDHVQEGDLAVFHTVGAYGATMASTYNSRALVPEVLVDDERFALVADRVDWSDLRRQRPAPWLEPPTRQAPAAGFPDRSVA